MLKPAEPKEELWLRQHAGVYEAIKVVAEGLGQESSTRLVQSAIEIYEYGEKLNYIFERHKGNEHEYLALSGLAQFDSIGYWKPSEEDAKLVGRNSALVSLDIESFYLFAEIMLSKASQTIEFCFGVVRFTSLHSHRDLVKNAVKYAAAQDLKLPTDFEEKARSLSALVYFRDKAIAHEDRAQRLNDWVIRSTFTMDGRQRVGLMSYSGQILHLSRDLYDLVKELDEYLGVMAEMFRLNKSRNSN